MATSRGWRGSLTATALVLLLACAASVADAGSPAKSPRGSTGLNSPKKHSKKPSVSPSRGKKSPRSPPRKTSPPAGGRKPPTSPASKPRPASPPSTTRLSPKHKSPKRPTSPPHKSPPRKPITSPPRASPPAKAPPSPKAASGRSPATMTKAACFPGNYYKCTDPRTANLLLRAPGNNIASPDVVPTLLPNDGSVLTINADQAYYLAGNYTQDFLAVNGRLYCGPPDSSQVPISITVRALLVAGHFQCGSATTPYTEAVNITLTGDGGVDGSKSIMVSGNISWHGAPRSTWTTLTTTILSNTNRFTTKDPVDWKAGEMIVVSSTTYSPAEYEEMTIATVEPSADGGSIITTTANFQYNHYGELQGFTAPSGRQWMLDERAQVGLLTRNIIVQGDDTSESSRVGGQLTVSLGGNAWIKHVLFFRMGEQGRLGSYPVHWHLLGDRTGNFIIGAVVWKSFNRCVTIHSTDNVLVERVICHDSIGHGFFMEDGCETGNKFRFNLGMTTRFPPSKSAGTTDTDTDRLATFWVTNPFNNYIGNVAAGSDFAGFWMVTPSGPVNKCLQGDQKPDLRPDSMSLGVYDHNIAHANQVGFAIEDGVCSGDRSPLCPANYKPPGLPRTISNLTLWKNSHAQRTIWITVPGRIDFKGCTFAGGRGTLFSGKQIISDTLFVGRSNNVLKREDNITSVNWGFGLYDGPVGLVNSFFTGYREGGMVCIAPVGSAFKGWNHFIQGVEFAADTLQRNKLNLRGNYSVGEFSSQAIIDVDGSYSGRGGGAVVVPWLNASENFLPAPGRNSLDFHTGADCTRDSNWRAFICPITQKMANIRLRHSYPISGPAAIPRVIDVIRSDGKQNTIDNNLGIRPWNQFNVIIGQGFTYTVAFRNRDSLMFQFDGVTPANFYVDLLNADPGDSTSLTFTNLPTGGWSWTAVDCLTQANVVPPTTEGTLTIPSLTANDNGSGGPFPNLKAGSRTVVVCASEPSNCFC